MKKKQEILHTARLTLKAFETCDKPQMMEIFYNKEIKKTYMLPDFPHRESDGAQDLRPAGGRTPGTGGGSRQRSNLPIRPRPVLPDRRRPAGIRRGNRQSVCSASAGCNRHR